MGSSLSPEQDALTNTGAAGRHVSLPGSSAQFVATNQGPGAMNWVQGSGAATSSVTSLLQQGLHCFRQVRSREGIALLAQAREQLLPEQLPLAAVLETLMQEC